MKIEFPRLTKDERKVATLWKESDREDDHKILDVLWDTESWHPRFGYDARLSNIYILSHGSLTSPFCSTYLYGWVGHLDMQHLGGKQIYRLVRALSEGSNEQVLVGYYIIRFALSKDIAPENFRDWLKTLDSYTRVAEEYVAQLRLARNLRKAAKRENSSPS